MCDSIKLCNGAFKAELVKGQWQYTPVMKKIGKRKIEKGSLKEKPQFEVIEQYESATVKDYEKVLRTTVVEITKYLKNLL